MTINQMISVGNSSFDFVGQALIDFDYPYTFSKSDVMSAVNQDYAGVWTQYKADCLYA